MVSATMIYKLSLQNHVDGLATRSWTFQPPVIVGRDPESGVCIEHPSISRNHCQFSLNGEGALMVKDLNSMNGTYVDDNRVQQKLLMPKQVVQIGAIRLQVEVSTEDEHASAPRHASQGNVETTQPMKVFCLDPPPAEKSWWRRLFG
jgi:pSer/pThr/pTyr-binding forkhead associated (FHA) protein